MMRPRGPALASLIVLIAASAGSARAAPSHAAAAPAPSPAPAPAPPQPYDGDLLRLSEILGSLSYLGALCDPAHKDPYRDEMQALLDAEAPAPPRKDEFAGAFNRGYRGLAGTYIRCTDNARALLERYRGEGAAIAGEVKKLYAR